MREELAKNLVQGKTVSDKSVCESRSDGLMLDVVSGYTAGCG